MNTRSLPLGHAIASTVLLEILTFAIGFSTRSGKHNFSKSATLGNSRNTESVDFVGFWNARERRDIIRKASDHFF
jgi:hypothetical protein